MAKKAADQIPDDPLEFLKYVQERVFDNSPAALARAAGVSRAAVNKWLKMKSGRLPPGLNAYMKTAIESELARLAERHAMVADIEVRAKVRADKMREALQKILRKMGS
jgi:transcriptional regulator with XRE-family HTH domain